MSIYWSSSSAWTRMGSRPNKAPTSPQATGGSLCAYSIVKKGTNAYADGDGASCGFPMGGDRRDGGQAVGWRPKIGLF